MPEKKVLSIVKRVEEKKKENSKPSTRIISVTSGKGGVGKSIFATNIAYLLADLKKKVLLVDADLGLANVDVLLGLASKNNISHHIVKNKNISDIIVNGPGGISVLPASSGIQELSELSKEKLLKFFSGINGINGYDVILFDTASGITSNTMRFIQCSNEVIILCTPEPTSITDAYALMKVLSLKYQVKKFRLAVNMVSGEEAAREVYKQLTLVTDRFLDVEIKYLGYIKYDKNMTKAVKRQKLISKIFPESVATKNLQEIAKKIENSPFLSQKNTNKIIL